MSENNKVEAFDLVLDQLERRLALYTESRLEPSFIDERIDAVLTAMREIVALRDVTARQLSLV